MDRKENETSRTTTTTTTTTRTRTTTRTTTTTRRKRRTRRTTTSSNEDVKKLIIDLQNMPQLEDDQGGEGYRGLMTDEIDDIMKYNWYLGTVASDEINKLKPEKRKKYGFIMNTDPSTEKGQHWIAVYCSLDCDRSIEIYDPLALYKPTEDFQHQMKQLIENSKPSTYLLMKVNQVKTQSDTSTTCGWHSIRFLLERAKGNRFKFASGWTDLKEKEAEELKAQNGYGFDTFI